MNQSNLQQNIAKRKTAYHFIAIANDYEDEKRIGWHYSSNEKLKKEVIKDFLKKSKEYLGYINFGIHKLSTENTSWESVVQKDSYFEDIFVIDDINKFLEKLIKGVSAD